MKHRAITGESYKDHYLSQIGSGMPVYSGATMQRGYGVGNILRGLFKVAVPLMKSVGRSALRRGAPILKEVGKKVIKHGLDEMTSSKRPKIMRIVGDTLRAATSTKKPIGKKKKTITRGRGRGRGRDGRGRNVTRDIFYK